MPALAQDEAVTVSNPLLFFTFQRRGRLLDPYSLKRSVYTLPVTGTPVLKEAEATLNLTTTKVSTGVYNANFTATSYTPGTHEVRWKYVGVSGEPEIEVRQPFEVLDKDVFFSGRTYVGYATTTDLKQNAIFAAQTVSALQRVINTASRKIEQLTGRFFEPRIQTLRLEGRGARGLALFEPIIGVSSVAIESGVTGAAVTSSDIGIDGLRFYARHLDGMLDPDDRDDPKIEIERFEGIIFQSLEFFPRAPQGVVVQGVFGYTDPNGSPFGMTPKNLVQAVGAMVLPDLQDPFGQNPMIQNPYLGQSARTRDQSVTFANSGGVAGGGGKTGRAAYGGLTGNDFIDNILIPYVRPIHMGVA